MTLRQQMIDDASNPHIFADVDGFQEQIVYIAKSRPKETILATVDREEDYAIVDGPNGPVQSKKIKIWVACVLVPTLTQGVNAGDGDVFVIDSRKWKVIGRPEHDEAMMVLSLVAINETEISAPGSRIRY